MLDRLATRQARGRQEGARRRGVHRDTISRGLARSAAGGVDALLAPSLPAGNPVSLAPAVRASPAPAPRRPEGFASYEARRPRARRTHGVEGPDTTRYALVRPRVTTKLQGARPRHTQKR